MTIRVDEEVGIYREGVVYEATSYEGEPWGVLVEIQTVTPLEVDDLPDWNIPDEEISRVRADGNGTPQVELIHFNVL